MLPQLRKKKKKSRPKGSSPQIHFSHDANIKEACKFHKRIKHNSTREGSIFDASNHSSALLRSTPPRSRTFKEERP